jgi:hypothetical protein
MSTTNGHYPGAAATVVDEIAALKFKCLAAIARRISPQGRAR